MAATQIKAFSLIFSIVNLALFSFSEAKSNGFSLEMFHRDSPDSPFHNPLATRSERLAAAFRRSIDRARSLNPKLSVSLNSAEAPVKSASGEYLVNIHVGTPPFPIAVVVDTGSDLIWTQCAPCDVEECYNQTAPLFDPRKSKTYRELPCDSRICFEIAGTACNGGSPCRYSVRYGDLSYTVGVMSVDTVTLGSTSSQPVVLRKTIFECGYKNQGTFRKEGSGIVGLGGGKLSLVSQMGSSINGKFSYCLVPYSSYETSKTGKLSFGDAAVVTGKTAVSTPLIKFNNSPIYFLNLQAISVGGKRVDYSEPSFTGTEANTIIDSGTTLTLLPRAFYSKLESAVAEQIKLKQVKDNVEGFDLCYESRSDAIKIPRFTVHFKGADLELTEVNTFIRITDDLVCFAFAPVENVAIYGNVAQANFLVGYDSVRGTVTFKPTDCSNAH